ncbi:MAG TPA: tetratricopeptide repeat protein, partial [Bacteroidia bacterium]
MRPIVTIVCLFISVSFAFAQPQKKASSDPEEAKEHYKHYNYLMAMPIYKNLLAKEPKNTEYNYRLGICYLRTHLNKAESVKYFEAASKDPKCETDTWFFLGRAYHLAGKYDEAIQAYTKYKSFVPKDKKEVEKTDHQIEMCNNAKELVKFPVNITFTNAGPEVNSEFPDYFPFITADEQTIFFTSRRKGGHATAVETDGYFSSDIFYCPVLDGKWDKAKNLSPQVNTTLDEEIVGLKPNGQELIVYIDHIDADKIENLYVTHYKNKMYTKLEKLSENVTN